MSVPVESVNFGDMIRDLLLALVSSQDEANKNFIADLEELASKDLVISYMRTVDGKNENREIKGTALSFGITPTLLNIQSAVIELRTALSVTKNTEYSSKTSSKAANYLFKTSTVDAKYQNTYSYKAEASSVIRLTVVPVPPSAALMDAIHGVAQAKPLTDKKTP
jgi:hypothetical protein